MKNIKILAIFLITAVFASCSQFENTKGTEKIAPISVTVKVNLENRTGADLSTEGLEVSFINYVERYTVKATIDADGYATAEGLMPGLYSIQVGGLVESGGKKYNMNASVKNVSLMQKISKEDIIAGNNGGIPDLTILPTKAGDLCFAEIFFCGSSTPTYFRDQFYEIYNCSDEVQYLDKLCFAQLHPSTATSSLPTWPESDGVNQFAYATALWVFPGTGTDYPLQPGESVVICQEAADHRDAMHSNGVSIVDNSKCEWECWSGNVGRQNPSIPDLEYKLWGVAGSVGPTMNAMQWLTGVGGSAFCLYKSSVEIDAAFLADPANWSKPTNATATTVYLKIPADDVIDGVELIPNMSSLNMKRVPPFIDAGATSVGSTYIGKSVARKKIGEKTDGSPIFADTDNSTEDFEVQDTPMHRRYGQKQPDWAPIKQ